MGKVERRGVGGEAARRRRDSGAVLLQPLMAEWEGQSQVACGVGTRPGDEGGEDRDLALTSRKRGAVERRWWREGGRLRWSPRGSGPSGSLTPWDSYHSEGVR